MNAITPATSQHLPVPQLAMSQYLTFMLAGEVYAIGILNIKEIIDYDYLTDVPMMPEFVRGVINLRGSVVPVIDLLARFDQGHTQIAKRTGIVIVETDRGEAASQPLMGIIVDAVNEVVGIAAEDIAVPPSFGVDIRPEFISGMVKRNGGFIVVLNVETLLSIEEMISLSIAK